MAYPTSEQYERWKARAGEFDMSVSEFMQAMIESGLKKFDAAVDPDETVTELREQRKDLKAELERSGERIDTLEQHLYDTDAADVARFIEENPDADYSEIVNRVRESAPKRVTRYLEAFENEEMAVRAADTESVTETRIDLMDAGRENVAALLAELADSKNSKGHG